MDLIIEYRKVGCPVTNCHNCLEDIKKWLITRGIYVRIDPTYSQKLDKIVWWAELFNLRLHDYNYKSFMRYSLPLMGYTYTEALIEGLKYALKIINDQK